MGLESMDLFGENSEGSQPIYEREYKDTVFRDLLSVGRI